MAISLINRNETGNKNETDLHSFILGKPFTYEMILLTKSTKMYEPRHKISNNVCGMCGQQSLRSACQFTQSDQSLCSSLEYSMSVKLLTDYHLEFLSLKEAAQARLSRHLSKCHIIGNHMLRLICIIWDRPDNSADFLILFNVTSF